MKVVDFQATPSGYYQISFRNDEGQTIVVTQHGRGGCNIYQPANLKPELLTYFESVAPDAIAYLSASGFPELAQAVRDRENEWEDSVALSIADFIDLGTIRIEG
jgi:hypothetical protein